MANERHVEHVERARKEGIAKLKADLDGEFARFIDKRVLSPALATREMDGRLVPFVLASVVDPGSQPVGGLSLELRDLDGNLLDSTRTSPGGIGILRFPARKPRPRREAAPAPRVPLIADGPDVSGMVTLLHGHEYPSEPVTITPAQQVARVRFAILGEGEGVPVNLPPGDDPITRLPIDFSEDSCNELLGVRTDGLLDPNSLTTRADPLLSPPAGVPTIAGRRLPLIRRIDVIRYAEDNSRYLVRLRQEWVLLTYTLGELADVTALDPGAVLQSAEQLVTEVSTSARDVATTATSTLAQTLQDTLSRLGTVDSVVKTVSNASASVGGSGWGIGIPGLVGYGSANVSADAHLDLSVSTNVNTSLLVNRAIQQAATLVNEALSKARATAEGIQRSANDVINHLAPLVTQVANALHWRVYEVYAVCTNVDAVHPIIELPLFPEPLELFTADDLRAYRPFFEPALLDRTLVGGFDALTKVAELPPLTEATVEVTINSSFRENIAGGLFSVPRPATVTVTLGAVTSPPISVPTGSAQTTTVRINFPAGAEPERGTLLTAILTMGATTAFGGTIVGSGTFSRVQVWIDRPLSEPGFIIDSPPLLFQVPIGGGGGTGDVLLTHVNHHRHYYFGVLATSAILIPSLRQDAPELATLDPRLWRLPLIGLEGTTVLLIDEPTNSVPASTLLDDPGAGTLVQILAPGSYGEMLTGLLSIPSALLHPLLQEAGTFSPFGPFPALPSGTLASAAAGTLVPPLGP